MKVFVAGSTGVIGKRLLPRLVEDGHDVVGLVRSAGKSAAVEALGAKPAVADALDRDALSDAVRAAEPEIIIDELTAIARMSGDFRRLDRDFALTNRLRTEATDTLLEAARLAGARRVILQSFCGWPFARQGGPVKTEADPLDPSPPPGTQQTLEAIRYLENAVLEAEAVEALALRYGFLYGPGTAIAPDGDLVEVVRRHRFPIVGDGAGVWSFVHVDDAVGATVAAMSHGVPGIYNIVDDEPAPVSTWLPFLADALGAKPPRRLPAWLARPMIGKAGVSLMTQIRGGLNVKAKQELGWKLIYPTWRRGFVEALG